MNWETEIDIYWSGLPCSPLGNLPNPRIKPGPLKSPALAGSFFTTSATWDAHIHFCCSSVTKLCPNSSWPHGLQHARLPCPSSPLVCSNTCPLTRWCHQPSHRLSSPFPPALNLSQYQDLFQWVSFLHQVAKVLELQFQRQSFQWIFRIFSTKK